MNLLDSLLDAIVRLEGDALVMHVGEKPYVVTISGPLDAQRGPMSWGQVELSSRVLTTDAVLGMLVQILPLDQRQALEEYGAIEHEIPAPAGSSERFTVIAARGGDDVWLEVRRRPKEEPAVPVSAPAPAEIVAAAATEAVVSPELPKSTAEEPADLGLQIIEDEEPAEEEEEVFEISLDAVSDASEQESAPPIEVVHEMSQSAMTDEDVDALVASMAPAAEAPVNVAPSTPEEARAPAEIAAAEKAPQPIVAESPAALAEEQEAEGPSAEATVVPHPASAAAVEEIQIARSGQDPEAEAPTPVTGPTLTVFEDSTSIAPAAAEIASDQPPSVAPVEAAVTLDEPKPVAPVAAPVPPEAVPAVAEAAAALEAFADAAADTTGVPHETPPASAPQIPAATAAVSQRAPEAIEVIDEPAIDVAEVVMAEEQEAAVVAAEAPLAMERPAEIAADVQAPETAAALANEPRIPETVAQGEPKVVLAAGAEPPVAAVPIAVAPAIVSEVVDEQPAAEPAAFEAEAAFESKPVVIVSPPVIQPVPTSETISKHAPAAEERAEPVIAPAPAAFAAPEPGAPLMPDVAAAAAMHREAAPQWPAPRVEVPSAAPAPREVEQPVAVAPSPVAPVEEPRPALVVPISRSPIRPEPVQTPPAALAPVEHMLRIAAARGAATVYIVAHSKPMIRVDGEISALENEPTFTTADVERLVMDIAPVRGRDVHGGPGEWMTDLPEVGRVRCVTFREHRGPGVIFRMIPPRAISADQLGLAAEVQALCAQPDGLVLVTGPRASGKSTLLSAFVDLINRTRSDHVITVESQINFVHESRKSFVSQREVRGDAEAAAAAVRSAFREDPDVLVIEDLRTAEIVSVAIEAAESGRLVLGSLSAPNTIAAIERLVELFSPERRAQVQTALAGVLRGVVAQVLPRKIKGGRVAAREVLLNTPSVASLILEGRTFQLPVALDAGRRHGMVPLTDSLAALIREGTVHVAEAYRKAPDREALLAVLKRDGVDISFAERLA